MAIGTLAAASSALAKEDPVIGNSFPVDGRNPEQYLDAAVKVDLVVWFLGETLCFPFLITICLVSSLRNCMLPEVESFAGSGVCGKEALESWDKATQEVFLPGPVRCGGLWQWLRLPNSWPTRLVLCKWRHKMAGVGLWAAAKHGQPVLGWQIGWALFATCRLRLSRSCWEPNEIMIMPDWRSNRFRRRTDSCFHTFLRRPLFGQA